MRLDTAFDVLLAILASSVMFVAAASDRDAIEISEAAVWTAQNQFPALQVDTFQGPLLPEPDDGEDGRSLPFEDTPPRSEMAETPTESAAVVPMKFEFAPQTVSVFSVVPCTVHGADWCEHCERQERDNDEGDDRVSFAYTYDPSPTGVYPCTTYVDATGQLRVINGYHTTDQIWQIIQRNNPPGIQQRYAATGAGGTLHARQYIQTAIDRWRYEIGATKADGSPVKVQAAWRRTGGQTFPLIHQKPEQWTFQNVMGTLGEFSFVAPGSKLPSPEMSLQYRRSNGQIRVTGELFLTDAQAGFPGDALSASGPQMAAPVGFGPMEVLEILKVIQGIISLLNPQADLTLGGQVTATCWLDDAKSEIHVEFQEGPALRVVAWWTFNLSVKSLVISPENIHIEFGGSKLIKSRDIRVE